MIRTIKNTAYTALLLFAMSCTEEVDYVKPIDIAWSSYISNTGSALYKEDIKANTGDYLILRDASQGALSHQWIIDDKSSFFKVLDDTTTVYEGKTITSADAYILFQKTGFTEVTLRNTYPTKVVTNTKDPIAAVYDSEKKVWVLERVFKIEVYGELKPAFTVSKIDMNGLETEVLTIGGDENPTELQDLTIKQGEKLRFVYDQDSEYKSTSHTWAAPSGTVDGDPSQGLFIFNTPTEEPLENFFITVNREAIGGEVKAAVIKKLIPIRLNVEEVSITPLLNGIKQINDNEIEIPFNKVIASPVDASLSSAFTVNAVMKDGTTQPIFVNSAVSNASSVILTVGEIDTYLTERIEVSYDLSIAKIYAEEDQEMSRPAESFANAIASPYLILKPKYFSFSNDPVKGTPLDIAEGWWVTFSSQQLSPEGSSVSIVEDKDGMSRSMCFDVKGDFDVDNGHQLQALFSKELEKDVVLADGAYKMRFKIFVETCVGASAFRINTGDWALIQKVDLNSIETGRWVDYECEFSITEGKGKISGMMIRVQQDCISEGGSAKFYIDNLHVQKITQ